MLQSLFMFSSHCVSSGQVKHHDGFRLMYVVWRPWVPGTCSADHTQTAAQSLLWSHSDYCHTPLASDCCLTLSVPHFFWLWQKWVYQSVQRHTGVTHHFWHPGTLAPEWQNVKKLKKDGLDQYSPNTLKCNHLTPLGLKRLIPKQTPILKPAQNSTQYTWKQPNTPLDSNDSETSVSPFLSVLSVTHTAISQFLC